MRIGEFVAFGCKMINALNRAENNAFQSAERLVTGKRVNYASDDPSAIGRIMRFESQIGSSQAVQRNIKAGRSLLETAENAMNSMNDIYKELKELSVQYNSGTLTDTDKTAISNRADELVGEINDILKNTKFNGQTVFRTEPYHIQTGTYAGDITNINLSPLVLNASSEANGNNGANGNVNGNHGTNGNHGANGNGNVNGNNGVNGNNENIQFNYVADEDTLYFTVAKHNQFFTGSITFNEDRSSGEFSVTVNNKVITGTATADGIVLDSDKHQIEKLVDKLSCLDNDSGQMVPFEQYITSLIGGTDNSNGSDNNNGSDHNHGAGHNHGVGHGHGADHGHDSGGNDNGNGGDTTVSSPLSSDFLDNLEKGISDSLFRIGMQENSLVRKLHYQENYEGVLRVGLSSIQDVDPAKELLELVRNQMIAGNIQGLLNMHQGYGTNMFNLLYGSSGNFQSAPSLSGFLGVDHLV